MYTHGENHEDDNVTVIGKGQIESIPLVQDIIEERTMKPSPIVPQLPKGQLVGSMHGINVLAEGVQAEARRSGLSEQFMDKKYRLQIDFSERAYKDLELLQEQLDANSKSEVIRNALGVLRWVVEEAKKGHRILVEKPEGPREIIFHFIDQAVSSEKDANVG